eukprot:11744689-Alexandrium_andersonii.AAC.1
MTEWEGAVCARFGHAATQRKACVIKLTVGCLCTFWLELPGEAACEGAACLPHPSGRHSEFSLQPVSLSLP